MKRRNRQPTSVEATATITTTTTTTTTFTNLIGRTVGYIIYVYARRIAHLVSRRSQSGRADIIANRLFDHLEANSVACR